MPAFAFERCRYPSQTILSGIPASKITILSSTFVSVLVSTITVYPSRESLDRFGTPDQDARLGAAVRSRSASKIERLRGTLCERDGGDESSEGRAAPRLNR